MIAELDQSGTTVKSHLWGLDLSGTLQGAGGVGGLLATIEGAERYSHTCDGNGNVTAVTKDDGTVAAYYEYDPFGNTSYMTGPQASANPYRFSTKYLDPETNLYYYGYRYYSPELGRWINRDPIEEQGGLNLYGFVGNNGVNKWDFLGQWWPTTHSGLTYAAWGRLNLPSGISSDYSGYMIDFIAYHNTFVDTIYADLMQWHYNRPIGSDPGTWISNYVRNIQINIADYGDILSKPDASTCKQALRIIGRLSHAWQDYYAHGVGFNYVVGSPDSEIGPVFGSPDFPALKPSSWGGFWTDPGEHGRWTDPGWRAADRQTRLDLSREFTAGKFNVLIPYWWSSCSCYADQVLP